MNHHEYSHSYPISLRVEPPFITISLGRSQGHLPHGPWPWTWPFCFPGCGYPAWTAVIVGPSGLFGSKYLKGNIYSDGQSLRSNMWFDSARWVFPFFPSIWAFWDTPRIDFSKNCPLRCLWISMPKVRNLRSRLVYFSYDLPPRMQTNTECPSAVTRQNLQEKHDFLPIIITMLNYGF